MDLAKAKDTKLAEIIEPANDCNNAQERLHKIKGSLSNFSVKFEILSRASKEVQGLKSFYMGKMIEEEKEKEGKEHIADVEEKEREMHEKVKELKTKFYEVNKFFITNQDKVTKIEIEINEFRDEVKECESLAELEEIKAPIAQKLEDFDGVDKTVKFIEKKWDDYKLYSQLSKIATSLKQVFDMNYVPQK